MKFVFGLTLIALLSAVPSAEAVGPCSSLFKNNRYLVQPELLSLCNDGDSSPTSSPVLFRGKPALKSQDVFIAKPKVREYKKIYRGQKYLDHRSGDKWITEKLVLDKDLIELNESLIRPEKGLTRYLRLDTGAKAAN
jgi:hypothetical protein